MLGFSRRRVNLMRAMLVRFSKWLVVAALVLTLGGHWAVLQIVAWTGMAVTYSQGNSLSTALAKTFDGNHLCKLCKMVSEAKKSESQSAALIDLKKMDFFALITVDFYFAPLKQNPFSPLPLLLARTQAPPSPPPISA